MSENNEFKTGVIYSQEIEPQTQHKVVAVRKDDQNIIAYKLEDGTVLDVAGAVTMCQNGQLEGVRVGVSRAGTEFIRGVADGDDSNNLDNLPRF